MSPRRFACALAAALALGSMLHAQVPGQNINMVTGTTFPGGDPWLQKQNEPSGAVSTENPCHLLAGANDYRAVNVPGNTGDKETGDAWVGWYTSINCGQTWYSTLVPGYMQDQSPAGLASPVKGLTTAADPTVRSGPGGFFAYSFIAFNRGSNVGKVAVARFLDKNNREAVTKAETAITYVDTKAWDSGSAGNYIDKPSVTISPGAGTCTIAGRTIPASVVHLTWTVFVGNNDDLIRTKVYYARSSNCGATLDGPATKLSEGYAVTQSASTAVAPNGQIYVVWRQFATTKGDIDQILVAKSVDGGKSFTKASPVPLPPSFMPFDQGTSSKTFRTNAYPSIVTDRWGRLYVALSVRGFAANPNQSRVVVTSTPDGVQWSLPRAIEGDANGNRPGDFSVAGHQIMPAMTAAGGKLNVVWLDFRDDASGEFHKYIKEIYPIRHTMDVRGAQATLQENGSLDWATYGILDTDLLGATAPRISKYLVGDFLDPNGNGQLKQLQFNRPNLKLYAGGSRPFIGDFIDLAGLAYLFQPAGGSAAWVPNDGDPLRAALETTAARTFYAFWTDNRDAKLSKFPSEPASADPDAAPAPGEAEAAVLPYVAPGPGCSAWVPPAGFVGPVPTKTRNSNVYMSRITPGVFVAAPTNSKSSLAKVLVPGATDLRVQRAFPIQVQNRTNEARSFRLTIANQPSDAFATGIATFRQVPSPIPLVGLQAYLVTSTDVTLPANSGTARTVYVISSAKYPRIKVDVTELNAAQPLTGSTVLNPDPQNADIENADIENADIENADIENKELHNADIENADIENADIENADIENADIENADIENADIENADIENADIENADIENADIENADIENADIENGAVSDYSIDFKNDGNTATNYQVKFAVVGNTSPYLFQLIGRRVYKTPTAVGCDLKEAGQNQILFNVNLTANDLVPGPLPDPLDPSATNTNVLVAPGEHIKVTLRVWDKDVLTDDNAPPDDGIQPFCPMVSPSCPVATSAVIATVGSVSANTGQNTPPADTFISVGSTLTVTNTNDSGSGSLRQAMLDANSQPGIQSISFNIAGTGVKTITPTSPLPQITEAVIIDGTTQPGYSGAPVIELNGTSAGPGDGLSIAPTAGGSIVRALAINRFAGNGIAVRGGGNLITANYIGTDAAGTQDFGNAANGIQIIDAANNVIGGGPAADRNVVSGNNGEGIRVDGALATGNMIRGNFIGLNAAGTAAVGNAASGVYLRKAPNNSVIQNVISGNTGFGGVAICGDPENSETPCGGGPAGTGTSDASGNIVQGNLIGTNAAGTGALGNGQLGGAAGVTIDAAPNTLVGGPLGGDRNVISANAGHGVLIFNPGANDNVIRGNFIGTDISGTAPLGNGGDGVRIAAGTGNVVSGIENTGAAPNVIRSNTGNGIAVTTSTGTNEFRINQIEANGGLGISGTTPGPNLTSAVLNGGSLTVAGTFLASPGTVTVDLYKSAACDPSGFGEGAQWVGFFTVGVPSDSPVSFVRSINAAGVGMGDIVTAVLTTGDQTTGSQTTGATTRFSNCQTTSPAGDLIVQSLTHSPASPTTADTITFTAVVKNNGPAAVPASTLLFKIGGETPGAPETLYAVPALASGATAQFQRQMTLTAQGYINTATADYTGVVAETNESNNTTTDSFVVTGAILLEPEALQEQMLQAVFTLNQ